MTTFQGPGVDDVDDAALPDTAAATVDMGNALDELRGIVTKAIAPPTETYPVALRPGWSVRYSAGIDGPQLARWVRAATPAKGPRRGVLDQTHWAALVLGTQCEAILKNGRNPTDQDQPITFHDEEWLEVTGASTVAEAVRLFYGGADHIGDGHVVAQAYDLIKAAGYDEGGVRRIDPAAPEGLEDEPDPTQR